MSAESPSKACQSSTITGFDTASPSEQNTLSNIVTDIKSVVTKVAGDGDLILEVSMTCTRTNSTPTGEYTAYYVGDCILTSIIKSAVYRGVPASASFHVELLDAQDNVVLGVTSRVFSMLCGVTQYPLVKTNMDVALFDNVISLRCGYDTGVFDYCDGRPIPPGQQAPP